MRPEVIVGYWVLVALLAACGKMEGPAVSVRPPALSAPALPLPDVGKIETVTVTATGSGPSAGVAVQEAMKLAVLEVNGATIDTSSVAIKFGLDAAEGQTAVMLRGATFAEAIAQRSRGAMTGFKLIELTEPAIQGGLYKATIEAAIAKFRPPEGGKKVKIAIAPLRSNSSQFAVGAGSIPASRVEQALHQQLIDALTATGRFSVLDREFGGEVQQELDLVATGQAPSAEVAKLGQTLSADLVWVGTINDFTYARTAQKLKMSDRERVSYSGGWSLSQRLLNVATRQIMLSNTLQQRSPSTEPTTFDAGVNVDETASSMEGAIISDTVAAILSRTFPITVLAKDGTAVVLSQGGQAVRQGARYAVVLLGKELLDPQTQQSLGRIETPCCEVLIDKVATTLSYGHLENAHLALESVDPVALQIREELRPAKAAAREKPEASPPRPPVSRAPGQVPEEALAPASDESKKW